MEEKKNEKTSVVESVKVEESTTNSKDVDDNKFMAILSYFGFLALIPYFGIKNSKFAQYHAKQGMNLLIVWIGYIIFNSLLSLIKVNKSCSYWGYTVENCYKATPWWISVPLWIISFAIGVLAIIGIINAAKGEEKELPIIGKYKIFK